MPPSTAAAGPRTSKASGVLHLSAEALSQRPCLLRLEHFGPDILHLLVQIGVRRRIGLSAREKFLLFAETKDLLIPFGKRCFLARRHAPITRRGGKPRLPFRAHDILDEFERKILVLAGCEHRQRLRPKNA